MKHYFIVPVISFFILLTGTIHGQKHWPGLASNIAIKPESLKVLWQMGFYVVPEGEQKGKVDEMHLPCGHGHVTWFTSMVKFRCWFLKKEVLVM